MTTQEKADIMAANIRTAFSEQLKGARIGIVGLSQSQLAEAAGVHKMNISKYERGEAIPDVTYTLPWLAAALDCTVQITLVPNNKNKHVFSPKEVQAKLDADAKELKATRDAKAKEKALATPKPVAKKKKPIPGLDVPAKTKKAAAKPATKTAAKKGTTGKKDMTKAAKNALK